MSDYPQMTDLRLEVEQPHPSGLRNLILNPNAALGGWGWTATSTGLEATVSREYTPDPATPALRIDATVTATNTQAVVESARFEVTPGAWVNAYLDVLEIGITGAVLMALNWYDAGGSLISQNVAAIAGTGAQRFGAKQVPSGAAYASFELELQWTSGTKDVYLIVGDVTVAQDATNSAALTALGYLDPTPAFTNILGSITEATVTREDLNVGELAATIKDVLLDPATNDLLRPGRLIRLTNNYPAHGDSPYHIVFTGRIDATPTVYDIAATDDGKRAVVSLHALDDVAILANTPAPDGYATAAQLTSVLERVAVMPWDIDGSDSHVIDAGPITTNPDASALDQVIITRDSLHGYAWVTSTGQFKFRSTFDPGPAAFVLNEGDYDTAGPEVTWDVDQVINDITITHRVRNAITGETVDVQWGPYQDIASAREWGARHRDITVQGLSNDAATMQAYALSIFAANAQPGVLVKSITYPIRDDDDAWTLPGKGTVDLYDLVQITNTDAGLDQAQRVISVVHDIAPGSWNITLGFAVDGGVAAGSTPSSTPPIPSAPSTVGITTPEKPHAELVKNTTQNLANNTSVAVTWPTHTVDVGGLTWSGGTATVPRAGRYLIAANVGFASNATGRRYIRLARNGTATGVIGYVPAVSGGLRTFASLCTVIQCAAGDTLAIEANQDSGAALAIGGDINTTLAVTYLD